MLTKPFEDDRLKETQELIRDTLNIPKSVQRREDLMKENPNVHKEE